jgi:transcriptional regulator with XRE-family HTH domain
MLLLSGSLPESFGARLRQRRERQQITLATIAEQTKIKLSLLEALERDDVSHWPSGIFRRAFIRAYALAIGLEPDVVVRDFVAFHPDPVEVVSTVPAMASAAPGVETPAVHGGPPMRFRYLVGELVDSVNRFWQTNVRKSGSDVPDRIVPERQPAKAQSWADPDLLSVAQLCSDLARFEDVREAGASLQEAARIVDALGLIVWLWDPQAAELSPAATHGYSDRVLAQLPRVRRDADNATAAAFRSAQTCVVNGSNFASDALVVPLQTPTGCVGVLAVELPHGSAQRESIRALVAIFASQLARLVGAARPPDAVDRRLA